MASVEKYSNKLRTVTDVGWVGYVFCTCIPYPIPAYVTVSCDGMADSKHEHARLTNNCKVFSPLVQYLYPANKQARRPVYPDLCINTERFCFYCYCWPTCPTATAPAAAAPSILPVQAPRDSSPPLLGSLIIAVTLRESTRARGERGGSEGGRARAGGYTS